MELMASCFDKLLRLIRQPIPESILGKLTFSVNIKLILLFLINIFLDSNSIELSKRETRHYASRFDWFDLFAQTKVFFL
jgi:hypothetical protein